jgi:hypothetical protein
VQSGLDIGRDLMDSRRAGTLPNSVATLTEDLARVTWISTLKTDQWLDDDDGVCEVFAEGCWSGYLPRFAVRVTQ